MSYDEYRLRMQAHRLRQIDEALRLHEMAWLNREIHAEKPAGKHRTKPVYTRFEKFFDYAARLREAQNAPSDPPESDLLSRVRAFRGNHHAGKL